MAPRLSNLALNLNTETAFTVLAEARALKAKGKDVVELEIGDSPFPSTNNAKLAGIEAIAKNITGYCPSLGIPELREAAAEMMGREFGVKVGPENIVVASGAKPFETYFAEVFLEPGDGVLIFSPHFPTYTPNLDRRGVRAVFAPLKHENQFRPTAADVEAFLANDPKPRGIFLNFPHNPTGGVAEAADLKAIADVVRGTDVMIFSDEPYCHMIWEGRHETILSEPGMLDQTMAAYTFSKSYSMSGWRIGFAVAHPEVVTAIGKLINTSMSCSPPFVQHAAAAALRHDHAQRDDYMDRFRRKVHLLSDGLAKIKGLNVHRPKGTFYVFPEVGEICRDLGITSHGLALYTLKGADDQFGVACLGGECFGDAGRGFLRFSCAEPDDRIEQALEFLPEAWSRRDRVQKYLAENPQYRLNS